MPTGSVHCQTLADEIRRREPGARTALGGVNVSITPPAGDLTVHVHLGKHTRQITIERGDKTPSALLAVGRGSVTENDVADLALTALRNHSPGETRASARGDDGARERPQHDRSLVRSERPTAKAPTTDISRRGAAPPPSGGTTPPLPSALGTPHPDAASALRRLALSLPSDPLNPTERHLPRKALVGATADVARDAQAAVLRSGRPLEAGEIQWMLNRRGKQIDERALISLLDQTPGMFEGAGRDWTLPGLSSAVAYQGAMLTPSAPRRDETDAPTSEPDGDDARCRKVSEIVQAVRAYLVKDEIHVVASPPESSRARPTDAPIAVKRRARGRCGQCARGAWRPRVRVRDVA